MVDWKQDSGFTDLLAWKFAYRWNGIFLSGGGNNLIAAAGVLPSHADGRPVALGERLFWNNLTKKGRVNELTLTLRHYFRGGLVSGIREAFAMQGIGLGLLKAKRLNPLEIFGGHGVKDLKGFHAIVAKAKEIEDRKKGFTA